MIKINSLRKNITNLVFVFISILTLIVVAIIFSLNSVDKVTEKTELLIHSHIPELRDIANLQNDVDIILINLHEYYATQDRQFYETNQEKISLLINELSRLNITEDRKKLTAKILKSIVDFETKSNLFDAEMSKKNGRDWDKLREHLSLSQQNAENIMEALQILSSSIRQRVSLESKSTLDEVKYLNNTYLVYSFVALIISIFIIYNLYCRLRDQSELYQSAYFDKTTSLPNRSYFEQYLAEKVAKNPNAKYTLFLINLDRFKMVTGSFGHIVGDRLLKVTSSWIVDMMKKQNVGFEVFQFTGVSWLILLPDSTEYDVASEIANNLLKMSNYPMDLGDREMTSSCSIGICINAHNGNTVEELLRNADAALRLSKRAGGNCYQFYDEQMSIEAEDWLNTENALRFAITRNEFELHYQPKYDAQTGQLRGAEALLRWTKDGTAVSPGTFIPIAESSGLIIKIGTWVLTQACAQWVEWNKSGLKPVAVAVNISALQFQEPDFANQVISVLSSMGMPPSMLELEITEEAAAQDPERVVQIMQQLKNIGVSIAIDDFGTGYSSLSYLRRFPVDVLKIDRTFITTLGVSRTDASVVKLILGFAEQLGLKVVAEGVETEDQYQQLKNWKCDIIQGYYFSKPLPASEYESLLNERNVSCAGKLVSIC